MLWVLPAALIALSPRYQEEIFFGVGYLLQKYVINLVIGGSVLTTFLLTYGFETLLVNLALRFFSADTRQTKPVYANTSLILGQLHVPFDRHRSTDISLRIWCVAGQM